jgi:hypothetical protein
MSIFDFEKGKVILRGVPLQLRVSGDIVTFYRNYIAFLIDSSRIALTRINDGVDGALVEISSIPRNADIVDDEVRRVLVTPCVQSLTTRTMQTYSFTERELIIFRQLRCQDPAVMLEIWFLAFDGSKPTVVNLETRKGFESPLLSDVQADALHIYAGFSRGVSVYNRSTGKFITTIAAPCLKAPQILDYFALVAPGRLVMLSGALISLMDFTVSSRHISVVIATRKSKRSKKFILDEECIDCVEIFQRASVLTKAPIGSIFCSVVKQRKRSRVLALYDASSGVPSVVGVDPDCITSKAERVLVPNWAVPLDEESAPRLIERHNAQVLGGRAISFPILLVKQRRAKTDLAWEWAFCSLSHHRAKLVFEDVFKFSFS